MVERDSRADSFAVTPSQTVGPFFAFCLTPRAYRRNDLVTNEMFVDDPAGERIVIEGTVTDGRERLVPDALIEFWQADADGRYAETLGHAGARGFGRAECDSAGRYRLSTIKPGAVPEADGVAPAPHVNVSIFAKGLQRQLFTRIYFVGDVRNEKDPVLGRVPEERRATLLAQPVAGDARRFRFDIRLRGRDETVFFEA